MDKELRKIFDKQLDNYIYAIIDIVRYQERQRVIENTDSF